MRFGGKKIVVDVNGFDDIDEDDEDEGITVQYWIGHSEDEDAIGIESGFYVDADAMPVSAALEVAKAIRDVARWPQSKEGRKEVARLREKLADCDCIATPTPEPTR